MSKCENENDIVHMDGVMMMLSYRDGGPPGQLQVQLGLKKKCHCSPTILKCDIRYNSYLYSLSAHMDALHAVDVFGTKSSLEKTFSGDDVFR